MLFHRDPLVMMVLLVVMELLAPRYSSSPGIIPYIFKAFCFFYLKNKEIK